MDPSRDREDIEMRDTDDRFSRFNVRASDEDLDRTSRLSEDKARLTRRDSVLRAATPDYSRRSRDIDDVVEPTSPRESETKRRRLDDHRDDVAFARIPPPSDDRRASPEDPPLPPPSDHFRTYSTALGCLQTNGILTDYARPSCQLQATEDIRLIAMLCGMTAVFSRAPSLLRTACEMTCLTNILT